MDGLFYRLSKWVGFDVISGFRRENVKETLKNITIKINPFHITAIKKPATMKSIPRQTLIRYSVAEEIKKELESADRNP